MRPKGQRSPKRAGPPPLLWFPHYISTLLQLNGRRDSNEKSSHTRRNLRWGPGPQSWRLISKASRILRSYARRFFRSWFSRLWGFPGRPGHRSVLYVAISRYTGMLEVYFFSGRFVLFCAATDWPYCLANINGLVIARAVMKVDPFFSYFGGRVLFLELQLGPYCYFVFVRDAIINCAADYNSTPCGVGVVVGVVVVVRVQIKKWITF